MNREILFRGKRVDNGKWIEGYLCFVYIDSPQKAQIYDPESVRNYDVYTYTVGQYTGLKDKNGKKIFEGDIVKHNGINYKIKYFEKYTQFAGTRDKAGIGMVWFNFNTCEVIGNIHDNPDLIGGNDKDVII